ncbi:hypothetical protein I8751_27520 [Nostocaceae cyanobacterium CENA357]|uniref:Uncharacterized protein n=1 Tax=Atlanticothrix silvestris CENA357 TaxID=1725252 RepID=A0A8J7L4I3_9CYAN|nr:hypothetical protein [Atlanticothrix silvestris]MBH8556025.1 hypothetical protein [Atlanticothrix silvestris CENA357]
MALRRIFLVGIGIIMAIVFGSLTQIKGIAQSFTDLDLAVYHAPIHYQDTDSTKYIGDYITRFDYDGNWQGTNNWDNLQQFALNAYAYYSVVETCTHWFITYSFFHPQDWTDIPFDQEHENDLEGKLAIVRKDGSTFGKLEGIVTVFHKDFYSYTPSASPLVNGAENIDGTLTMNTYNGSLHPLTTQEAKGHGLKAWPYTSNFKGASNEDGIIYYPSKTTAELPASGNDRNVQYLLLDVFASNGMWQRQLNEASLSSSSALTFASWGTFKGDTSGGCGAGTPTCSTNSANAPWGWDDSNDGSVYKGEMALDPAHLTDVYFDGLGNFDTTYIRNQFIQDLKDRGYNSANLPQGWPTQINLNSLIGKLKNQCF